ncbi:MAG: ribokinase [Terrimicrobiaceae bacterium]
MPNKTVTIIGSYNVGLFLKGEHLPDVGETVIGDSFYEGGGGKGSNQAVAAASFSGKVRFIGCVGLDKYGQDALQMYKRLGIDCHSIRVDPSIHTGISVILIDKYGHNSISVVLGANGSLSAEDINASEAALRASFIVGFQLENDRSLVEYAIRKVHALGVATFLDPAPAAKLPDDLYPCLDYIKPNETEAATLTGIKVTGLASAEDAGRWFIARGVRHAIITLGEHGAVLVTAKGVRHFQTPKVKAVDTTGAGDTFAGGFLSALSGGSSIEGAIDFANHAAALSVTRLGVIDAIPTLDEVKALMRQSRGVGSSGPPQ